jgi:2-oxo-3-hexenedioate decarboxylase
VNSRAAAGSEAKVETLARALLAAWDGVHCIALPSAAGLSAEEAYAVGERLRVLRTARGERQVGWKIGFTNRSIWARYRVYQPMWAPVYDSTTTLLEGRAATLSLAGLSQPRIEPEVAFGIARTPRPGMSLAELRGCIDWVAHSFEIVHTHFEGWRFTAPDTAADFALHGRLFVGPRVPVQDWAALAEDLAALRVELACSGAVKDRGVGSVVLDGPLHALKAMVVAMASTTPHWQLAPGDVVTTGTLTDAWPLAAGQRWNTLLSNPRLAPLELAVAA